VSAIWYIPVVDPVTAATVTVTNHMHIYGNRQPSGRYRIFDMKIYQMLLLSRSVFSVQDSPLLSLF